MDIFFVMVPFGSDLGDYEDRIEGALPLVCSVRGTPCGRFVTVVIGANQKAEAVAHLVADGFEQGDFI
jgi:hypothetical protein